MRPIHYISVAAAIGLGALLYWGGNTIPPKKATTADTHQHTEGEVPHMGQPGQMPEAASPDSLLAAARKELPEHAATEIAAVEKEIAAKRDSAAMSADFVRLAKLWQEHKNLPIAAYYHAKAAKLENSEKNLNFAGQFFLNLMHEAQSPEMQIWEAREAAACFQRSLELNPENDTVKMALAATYIEGTGETMQGVQLLLGVTREKPDNVPANLMLGRLSIQSGQFDKAIGRFETVLKTEPKNTEALYFLAEAYKGKGDKEKAIELFEKCKQIVNRPEFSKDIDEYINSFK